MSERMNLERKVLALHKPDMPLYEIAKRAGCHTTTVRTILQSHLIEISDRLVKKPINLTPEQAEKFLILYFGTEEKSGRTLKSAAELVGSTVTIAKRYMKENEIPLKKVGGQFKKKDTV